MCAFESWGQRNLDTRQWDIVWRVWNWSLLHFSNWCLLHCFYIVAGAYRGVANYFTVADSHILVRAHCRATDDDLRIENEYEREMHIIPTIVPRRKTPRVCRVHRILSKTNSRDWNRKFETYLELKTGCFHLFEVVRSWNGSPATFWLDGH